MKAFLSVFLISNINTCVYHVYNLFTMDMRIIKQSEITRKILPTIGKSWDFLSCSLKKLYFIFLLDLAVRKVVQIYSNFILKIYIWS